MDETITVTISMVALVVAAYSAISTRVAATAAERSAAAAEKSALASGEGVAAMREQMQRDLEERWFSRLVTALQGAEQHSTWLVSAGLVLRLPDQLEPKAWTLVLDALAVTGRRHQFFQDLRHVASKDSLFFEQDAKALEILASSGLPVPEGWPGKRIHRDGERYIVEELLGWELSEEEDSPPPGM